MRLGRAERPPTRVALIAKIQNQNQKRIKTPVRKRTIHTYIFQDSFIE